MYMQSIQTTPRSYWGGSHLAMAIINILIALSAFGIYEVTIVHYWLWNLNRYQIPTMHGISTIFISILSLLSIFLSRYRALVNSETQMREMMREALIGGPIEGQICSIVQEAFANAGISNKQTEATGHTIARVCTEVFQAITDAIAVVCRRVIGETNSNGGRTDGDKAAACSRKPSDN
ncbi:hypothetical protein F5Y12DRAFT_16654 [Xylaria sp. FL1777]|nr:hypothetical protein F5Y12DRAFT_16654 [Xylaria sp. FL1777]